MIKRRKVMKRLILFLLLVVPGSAVVIASSWWGLNDFVALVDANQRFQQLANQGAGQRELFIIAHQEDTHRINVGFDGTWILLGGILAAMGILGIMQTNKPSQ